MCDEGGDSKGPTNKTGTCISNLLPSQILVLFQDLKIWKVLELLVSHEVASSRRELLSEDALLQTEPRHRIYTDFVTLVHVALGQSTPILLKKNGKDMNKLACACRRDVSEGTIGGNN